MNEKPKQTARQQMIIAALTQKVPLPFWVFLMSSYGFFFLGLAGGRAGAMPESGPWTFAAIGAACLLLPFVRAFTRPKLAKDQAAVSPVIGVILMVAITVVLAAVVFVFVSKLGNTNDAAPEVAFSKDDGGAAFTVLRAAADLDWSDFTVTGCSTVPTGAMDAGDQMTGCAGRVTVMHEATNTLVFQGEGA